MTRSGDQLVRPFVGLLVGLSATSFKVVNVMNAMLCIIDVIDDVDKADDVD